MAVLFGELAALFLLQEAINAAEIESQNAKEHHLGHAQEAADGELVVREGVGELEDGGLDGRAQGAGTVFGVGKASAALRRDGMGFGHRQPSALLFGIGLDGALLFLKERTGLADVPVKVEAEGDAFLGETDAGRLAGWAAGGGDHGVFIQEHVKVIQPELPTRAVRFGAGQGGGELLDVSRLEHLVDPRTDILAIVDQQVEIHPRLNGRHVGFEQVDIHGAIGSHAGLGDQLQRIIRVAGLAQIGHVAFEAMPILDPVAGFQIIHRLQAARLDLGIDFGAGLSLDQDEVLIKEALCGGIDRRLCVDTLQVLEQLVQHHPNLLNAFPHGFFPFDPVGVLPGAFFDVRGKHFVITRLIFRGQEAMQAL